MKKEYLAIALVNLWAVFLTDVDAGNEAHGYVKAVKGWLQEEVSRGYSILTVDGLSEITRKHFQSTFIGGSPGLACGDFRGAGVLDCAVVITKDEESRSKLKVVYVENVDVQPVSKVVLVREADYPFTAVFLRPAGEGNYPDRRSGGVVRTSGAGFEVVFFEKYSILFYWEEGTLKKVWTSD